MSVYGQVQTQCSRIDVLEKACQRVGLPYRVGQSLDYHKWVPRRQYLAGKRGRKRGTGAILVIENLDTTPAWFCGETAFVPEPDGTLRAEIDIAHGNAKENWAKLQNEYACILVEEQAARQGMRVEREQTPDGKIKLRLIPTSNRLPAARNTAQRTGTTNRPAANRPQAARR